jgi:hypothetical protein
VVWLLHSTPIRPLNATSEDMSSATAPLAPSTGSTAGAAQSLSPLSVRVYIT